MARTYREIAIEDMLIMSAQSSSATRPYTHKSVWRSEP
jgi:hypothetical protein